MRGQAAVEGESEGRGAEGVGRRGLEEDSSRVFIIGKGESLGLLREECSKVG